MSFSAYRCNAANATSIRLTAGRKKDFDDFSHFFDRVGWGASPADAKIRENMRMAIQNDVEKAEMEAGFQIDGNAGARTNAVASLKAAKKSVRSRADEIDKDGKPNKKLVRATVVQARSVAMKKPGEVVSRLSGSLQFDTQFRIVAMAAQGQMVPQYEVYVLPKPSAAKHVTAKMAKAKLAKNDKPTKSAKLPAKLASSKSGAKIAATEAAPTKAVKLASLPPSSPGRFLGGETVDLNQYDDPRQALVDWLHKDPTRYFARVIVNRIWARYFNVGIVQPTDDLNQAHPPSNPELLDYLTTAFVEHGYDLKWLQREIMNSRTYQLSWLPNDTNALDERNFSHAVPRRLPAEVAYDALRMATAGNEELKYDAERPDSRSIGLDYVVGSKTGKPVPVFYRYALSVFGKPDRLVNSDCERSNQPSLLQTFYMENDQETLDLIDRTGGWLTEMTGKYRRAMNTPREVSAAGKKGKQRPAPKLSTADVNGLVEEAFLRTLSRPPRADELARGRQAIAGADTPKSGLRELLWALLNTKEFIVNH